MTIEEIDKKIKLENDIAAEARKRVAEYDQQRAAELKRQAAEDVVGKCYRDNANCVGIFLVDGYLAIKADRIQKFPPRGTGGLIEIPVADFRSFARPIFARLHADIFGEAMPDADAIAKLRVELENEEQSHLATIAERDAMEDVIAKIHVTLGGDGEWGDLCADVPVLASEIMAELESFRSAKSIMPDTTPAVARVIALGEEVARLQNLVNGKCDAIAKLQKFKDYVHHRLDEMGVPHEVPESQHTKEGCRIGGRLDWLVAEKINSVLSDNPANDGTDKAHPAWNRGEEAGRELCAKIIRHLVLIGVDPESMNMIQRIRAAMPGLSGPAEAALELAEAICEWSDGMESLFEETDIKDKRANEAFATYRAAKLAAKAMAPVIKQDLTTAAPSKLPDGFHLKQVVHWHNDSSMTGHIVSIDPGTGRIGVKWDGSRGEVLEYTDNIRALVIPISNDESDSSGEPKDHPAPPALPTPEEVAGKFMDENWAHLIARATWEREMSSLIARDRAALLEAHASALDESGDHGAASHLRTKFGKGN